MTYRTNIHMHDITKLEILPIKIMKHDDGTIRYTKDIKITQVDNETTITLFNDKPF